MVVAERGEGWLHGWVVCGLCGHRQMSVWPEEADGKPLQCERCGEMAGMPEPLLDKSPNNAQE